MNINKFTQSSMAAVQNLEKIAADYGNQEIEQEHLLYSLLTIDDSLILKLIEKMGITKETMMNRVEELLRKRPKVQGGQMYIGQNLNNVLIHGEDEAKQMGDEYVSVEHLFLALLKYANREIKGMMKELGITRESFLQVLSSVRGNQRVTSDNPEATYDTLNKYGEDLVEKAREQKLDPVIGRDAEIRNVIHIQCKYFFIFQSFRYITTHNTLCQTFYCCCLTYTRFTDQNRVILGLTGKRAEDRSGYRTRC